MSDDEQEVVKCLQCDWPLLRGQEFTVIVGLCPDCGIVHHLGVVHSQVCVIDIALGVERALTQKRRAGALRMN